MTDTETTDTGTSAIATALVKAQGSFPKVKRDKTVTVRSERTGKSYTFSYAPLDTILEAVRKPLADNGLVVVQMLDEGNLVTMLLHTSGERIFGSVVLPGTNDIQGFGSAVTYLRRYAIQAMLGIAAEDDDDGNRAAGNQASTDATADEPESTETKGGETLELLGTLQKAGTVGKGSGKYQLEWRESPEGAAIGFRLKLPEKDIPQVLVVGELGTMLQLVHPDGASLDGHHVTVKGRLYAVRQTGRRTYNRLVIGERPDTHFIETPEARIPARVEAESVPMLPLDDDEKAAIAGGVA
jgi:hypothetical protein